MITTCTINTCRLVEPVYYGHLGTTHTCLDDPGALIFQVGLYDKAPLVTNCVDYASVPIFKCPD